MTQRFVRKSEPLLSDTNQDVKKSTPMILLVGSYTARHVKVRKHCIEKKGEGIRRREGVHNFV